MLIPETLAQWEDSDICFVLVFFLFSSSFFPLSSSSVSCVPPQIFPVAIPAPSTDHSSTLMKDPPSLTSAED